MRLRWDEIITRLSYRFNFLAIRGTSVEMLEDFYGKKRMRDPKMATEVTRERNC